MRWDKIDGGATQRESERIQHLSCRNSEINIFQRMIIMPGGTRGFHIVIITWLY